MNDHDRAERVFGVPGVMVLAARADEALDAIAAEFAAVRAEERARIVAWLRPRAEWGLLPSSYCEQIEHGAHEAPR